MLAGRPPDVMNYTRKALVWVSLIVIGFILLTHFKADFDWSHAAALLALCFTCELIDSGLGMGYGTILTPTLLLLGYSAADIVPTVLVSELCSGFAASFFHHDIKNVDLKPRGRDFLPAVLLASGSVVGVTIGVSFALSVPGDLLKLAIGVIVFSAGLFVVLLSRRTLVYRHWKMLLLSGIASFNKAVSGGGYGPLVTSGQLLTGVRSQAAVGITSFAEAFTCVVAVALFTFQGESLNFDLLLPMCTGALISVPCSVFAIHHTTEDRLKTVIGVLTMIMGGLTLWKALA